ncbi:damage-inducible protein DinB [Pedobacter polaris]|uniref:Damage-inducible protein DinB n=1 Tax=Pedobacter polaris TaxID=2571273 RepID=A0A4U1CSR7_9SPHI|nr:DinB family protein [Pedobacter polaris]TKC12177.1 damage-inducible protein DinB [Pedobacter polaris]
MKELLKQQYELVLSSRNTLIEYLKTIRKSDLLTENSSFGRGSIRNLLVHICDTYASWIGQRALGKEILIFEFNNFKNIEECLAYFRSIDIYIADFIVKFENDYNRPIEIIKNGEVSLISPLTLFTHVITHEFHHKGQIMSLSRHLNYIPVDADIIR